MKQEFNVIYERDGDWWVATAVEMPGGFSQGRTIDEARTNLFDALRELTLARREEMEAELVGKSDVVRERIMFEIE